MTAAHLSLAELRALDLLGEAATAIREVIGDGPNAAAAWREAADKVHQLQAMVMSQAAARACPGRFRLLGESWPAAEPTKTSGPRATGDRSTDRGEESSCQTTTA